LVVSFFFEPGFLAVIDYAEVVVVVIGLVVFDRVELVSAVWEMDLRWEARAFEMPGDEARVVFAGLCEFGSGLLFLRWFVLLSKFKLWRFLKPLRISNAVHELLHNRFRL
jgi:hypothetical protein